MAKHNMSKLREIKTELERRGLAVRVTSKGHLLITGPDPDNPGKKITTMVGGESLSGRNNRRVHDTKKQLRRVKVTDINTRH